MRRLRRDLRRRLNLDLDALALRLANSRILSDASAWKKPARTRASRYGRGLSRDASTTSRRRGIALTSSKTASSARFTRSSVPVPLSEPGESPILIICCVSSP